MRVARFPFTFTRTTSLHNKCRQCYFSTTSTPGESGEVNGDQSHNAQPHNATTSAPGEPGEVNGDQSHNAQPHNATTSTPGEPGEVNGDQSHTTQPHNTTNSLQERREARLARNAAYRIRAYERRQHPIHFTPTPALQDIQDPFAVDFNPLHHLFKRPFEKLIYTHTDGATPTQAEEYLQKLRKGEFISSQKWDQLVTISSNITEPQANELLKYGRAAKFLTRQRYFQYLYCLAIRSKWVSVHLGLTAMKTDGVKLSNYHYFSLAKASVAEYSTVNRFLMQIDQHRPTFVQLFHPLQQLVRFTISEIERSLFRKPHLKKEHVLRFFNAIPHRLMGGSPNMYNVALAHFDSERDQAVVMAMHDDMIRQGFSPNALTYEILSRGAPTAKINDILQQMKQQGIIPSVKTYTKLMMRVRSNFDSFYAVYQDMVDNKVPLDVAAYEAIMLAHLHHGHRTQAFEFMRTMLEAGTLPDMALMNTLRDAFKSDADTGAQLDVLWKEVQAHQEAAQASDKAAKISKMATVQESDEW